MSTRTILFILIILLLIGAIPGWSYGGPYLGGGLGLLVIILIILFLAGVI